MELGVTREHDKAHVGRLRVGGKTTKCELVTGRFREIHQGSVMFPARSA